MTDHAAVRAGDEAETAALLLRLTRQAARRGGFPPPSGGTGWSADDVWEFVGEVYDRKGQFVDVAIATTVTERDLEVYLLRVIENVMRDQARETERGKLIERLKTILNPEPHFLRHTDPYNAWRLHTAPDQPWQGDIGHLIRAALALRGISVTDWTTAGKTPKSTRDAIVRVCEASLDEASGYVRDPDLALVVQTCIPAVPLGPRDVERTAAADDPGAFEALTQPVELPDLPEPDEATAEDVATALWAHLTHDERRALPHLHSDRRISTQLGLTRRAATAVADSVKAKVRTATTPGLEADVTADLLDRALAMEADDEGPLP